MHHAAIRSLIQDRYATAHDASPAGAYPSYLTIGSPEKPQAVLGFRSAGAEPLFLERYLDQPIEEVLTARLARPVPRGRIVELGDHASHRPGATIALWREAAVTLASQADIAVAVLTRPMRTMFQRLDLELVELAPARIEAMGDAARHWGRYYETDPLLCAGDIARCRAALERAIRRGGQA
ncbi:thermostable hemolysin [Sphingomonas sp. MMS24-J13]|uniref:thermostable hemolysin n=1 Tax=Sphingomonas sp. MMS24-J13 TaxID=3238686 RepID=UPI00384E43B1